MWGRGLTKPQNLSLREDLLKTMAREVKQVQVKKAKNLRFIAILTCRARALVYARVFHALYYTCAPSAYADIRTSLKNERFSLRKLRPDSNGLTVTLVMF